MKKTPFPKFFALCCLSFVAATWGEAGSADRVNIEAIQDLRLSGYNQDAGGELQWRLEADSAEIDASSKGKDIRSALWNLHKLHLSTMGKDGAVFAEMRSDSGRFSPENHAAESDAPVRVKGEDFEVSGVGWSWTGKGRDNEIRINGDVSVSINRADSNQTIFAKSKSLKIVGTETQTVLTLFGNVRVSVDDIYETCDTLEILVPDRASLSPVEREGADGGNDLKSTVKSIIGRGNVEMTRGGVRINGDFAEFLPQGNFFFVRGNVRLNDREGRVSVRGDEALGEIERRFVEIIATQPDVSLPSAPVAVSVVMPSLVSRGEASYSSDKTVLTGKKMTVLSLEEKTEIAFFENVVAVDRDIRIDADKLVVETLPFTEKMSDLDALSEDRAAVKEIVKNVVATGNVRAVREGMTLTCARADIFSEEKKIELSGSPKIVSARESATLSGYRAEIFLDKNGRDSIEVYAEEKTAFAPAAEASFPHAPASTRVTVSFPPFSRIVSASDFSAHAALASGVPAGTLPAPAMASVVGDHLTVLREDGQSTFDMAGNVLLASEDLGGSCDRIVIFVDTTAQDANRHAQFVPTQIQKIIADGNLDLAQEGYRLTGGRALITPNIRLSEWVESDDTGEDGASPFLVVVEPNDAPGTRPQILFPEQQSGKGGLAFALPESDQESHPAGTVLATAQVEATPKTSRIESDAMELFVGENRIRFFLRGNVALATDGGATGACDTVEGLLRPQKSEAPSRQNRGGKRFDPEKVICRGNVRLAQNGAEGTGSALEIFPPKNRAILSGNAKFSGKDGVQVFPGNDRFVFDLENQRLLTGENDGENSPPGSVGDEDGAVPVDQVSRPRIVIPAGQNRVFIVPKSVQRKEN